MFDRQDPLWPYERRVWIWALSLVAFFGAAGCKLFSLYSHLAEGLVNYHPGTTGFAMWFDLAAFPVVAVLLSVIGLVVVHTYHVKDLELSVDSFRAQKKG